MSNPQLNSTDDGKLQCEPQNFTRRIINLSLFNDIVWDAKGNDDSFVSISKTVKQYARRFLRGHWFFLGLGSEKKWYGTYDCKPDGSWNRTAEKMLLNFSGFGHPIYSVVPVPWRGESRSTEKGKKSMRA